MVKPHWPGAEKNRFDWVTEESFVLGRIAVEANSLKDELFSRSRWNAPLRDPVSSLSPGISLDPANYCSLIRPCLSAGEDSQ